MSKPRIKSKLTWSFVGPPYWELQQMDPRHGFFALLKLCAQYGFNMMPLSISQLEKMPPEEQEELAQFLADNNMKLHPSMWMDYLKISPDEARRRAEEYAEKVRKYSSYYAGITTTGAHAGHRFDRTMPLEEKLERLSRGMAPLAAICKELGMPLAVENHGDYYCSDLVKLCQMTPDLYIFLDTGNTYLIGEAPLPAYEAAAPYTIGTHFKDHRVQPNPKILHFEIGGSVLGDGDAHLRECYNLLMERSPFPDKLVMEVEMVKPEGMDAIECMEKSIEFINSLEGGK